VDRKFVKTVSYKEAELLLSGKNKLNLWVDGDSGLGKTSCILNILRQQNREAIRFNCSYHQDVDDLIGGHRLIGGDTVYFDGAVVVAQERGATLLLDEVDAADPKLLFEIQSVLEGNGVLLKKIGRMSYPKPGFQVIATGNTKGRGDLTGDFAGTNVQNKSFLDRFDAAMTWKAPVEDEMTKILKANSSLTEDVISLMAKWYYQILQGAEASVVPVIVSPRRMLSIGKILENFGVTDPMDDKLKKAVGFSVNNFDEEVRDAFIGMLDLQLDEYKTSKIPQATADDIVNGELSGDEPF
jgi:MoxR-like ATPase